MSVPIQEVALRFKVRLKVAHLALVFLSDILSAAVQHGSLPLLPTMIDSPLFRVGRLLHDIPDPSVTSIIKTCIIALILLLSRGVPKWFLSIFFMPLSDPLRHLPGPPGSYFQTHFREVLE